MRILHTADWHLGKKLYELDRLEEQRNVLQEIVAITDFYRIDVVLIAGDIFDSFSPPVEAIQLFYQTLEALTGHGKRLVIAIAGNHDLPQRIEAPAPLANKHGIILVGFPNKSPKVSMLPHHFQVLNCAEGFLEIYSPQWNAPLRIILTPYANEIRFQKYLKKPLEAQQLRQLVSQQWQQLANTYCNPDGVNILLTHLFMIETDKEPTVLEADYEQSVLYVGGAQNFWTSDIPSSIQYTALGHLHQQHFVAGHCYPVAYSGSILQYSFSESLQNKFVLVVEISPRQSPHITQIPITTGRNLRRISATNVAEAIQKLLQFPEDFIELQIAVDSYLELSDKKSLYSAHSRIASLIPISNVELAKQPIPFISQTHQDILSLFSQYYSEKKGKPLPYALRELLKEIISEKASNEE
ncbi:MAG: exonuclease subunit SbcD [Cytophagales bacterium]|nr:exonuclease subunit SbcD [Cytophagales bacterium]MDW8383871.1 exonuclease subunit SbcD [Flammeovirgaceae bacterium]